MPTMRLLLVSGRLSNNPSGDEIEIILIAEARNDLPSHLADDPPSEVRGCGAFGS